MESYARRVTLQDVAREAGCSLSTASTILNKSRGNSLVSDATRERILATAKRLGYRPNLNARRLASARYDDIIAVLIDSGAPFLYRDILGEFEKMVSDCGLHLMVGMLHNDLEQIRKYVNVFLGSGISRVFCMTHTYPEFGDQVPPLFEDFNQVVFFGEPMAPTNFPYIATDDRENYRQAVKYLLDLGRRNVFHLRRNRIDSSFRQAQAGFMAAFEETGLVPPAEPFQDCFPDFFTSIEDAENALLPLLERKPDALILHDDESVFWSLRVLQRQGIKVPEDISLMSGNLCRFAKCSNPSLAGISFNAHKIGALALDIFNKNIQTDKILVPAQIVGGESCCPLKAKRETPKNRKNI